MNKVIGFYKLFLSFITKFRHNFYNSTCIKVAEDYSGYVYNLSIEDDETYIANSFVVHNCRSTVSPLLRKDLQPDDTDDDRPAVGADGPTTVSANLTYDQWLRRQPSEFQDEVLGETRGALFRRGDMEVRQFRDETGRTYTLEQLRDLMPLAFKKANID